MSQLDWNQVGNAVFKIGSLAGLLALPYSAWQNIARKPRIKFDSSGFSGGTFTRDELEFAGLSFSGTIKNCSADPNTISELYVVVWGNRKKNDSLTFGHNPTKIHDTGIGQDIKLPIKLDGSDAKKVQLTYEVVLTGSHDKELFYARKEIKPGTGLFLPKHEYKIVIRDVYDNYFDEDGHLINRKELDLRWTIGNTFNDLRKGNIFPWLKHVFKIKVSRFIFFVRKVLWSLGLRK